MQNEAMNLYKDMSEKAVTSAKSLCELNMRTFETLASKQVEMLQSYVDVATRQVSILNAGHDAKDLMAAQTDLANQCADQFSSNITATTDILNTSQEELVEIIEGNVAEAKSHAEKVVAISKKSVETAAASVKSVKPAKSAAKAKKAA